MPFPVDAVAAKLSAGAATPAALEDAVVSSLELNPREEIRDRAVADCVCGLIARLLAAGSHAEAVAVGASVAHAAMMLAAADPSGWGSVDVVTAFVEARLVEETRLSPDESDQIARYLAVTLFSQWELHRRVFCDAPVHRETRRVVAVVDPPLQPRPLREATLVSAV